MFQQAAALGAEERRSATASQPAAKPEAVVWLETNAGVQPAAPPATPPAAPPAAPLSRETWLAEHLSEDMRSGAQPHFGVDAPDTIEQSEPVEVSEHVDNDDRGLSDGDNSEAAGVQPSAEAPNAAAGALEPPRPCKQPPNSTEAPISIAAEAMPVINGGDGVTEVRTPFCGCV